MSITYMLIDWFRPVDFLALNDLWPSNLLSLRLPDEDYSRKAWYELNKILF